MSRNHFFFPTAFRLPRLSMSGSAQDLSHPNHEAGADHSILSFSFVCFLSCLSPLCRPLLPFLFKIFYSDFFVRPFLFNLFCSFPFISECFSFVLSRVRPSCDHDWISGGGVSSGSTINKINRSKVPGGGGGLIP